MRIAVLGGGPMGLAVAYQLSKDGYKPVLFEADNRLGGMTATFNFSGVEIERYYHFHCTSDAGFLGLIDELGLSKKMRWSETKMGYWYQGRLQPWGNPLALLKFKGLSFTAKVRYGLHAFLSTKRNNWRSLDKIEATSWIKKWVGNEAYEVLWRRLFEYKFYEYSQSLSAAWIWSRIRRIGRSRYNLFREKLGYLEGGSNVFLSTLADKIRKHGGVIRLSSPIDKVIIESGIVKGVQIGENIEYFDKVISTIPLPYVSKIIPDLPVEYKSAYESIINVAVVCVIVKLKKSLTENFWLNVNDDQMDIPGLVEYTNLQKLDDHIVYVPFYMPGNHDKYFDSNEVFINKVKTYLLKINSSLTESDFIDIHASRYRYSQPVCPPNFSSHLPPIKLPIKGLWIADTSYYYPEDRGISESIDFGRSMAKQALQ